MSLDKGKLLDLLMRHKALFCLGFRVLNRLPFLNSYRGKLQISTGLSYLKGCKIISHGEYNRIIIGDFCQLTGCTIEISGSHNTIQIGSRCVCNEAVFCIEDDHNSITLGERTLLCGAIELAAIEGTAIEIGNECLFSKGIDIRTGDSHSLVEKDSGNRINPSKSIRIGNHVWVGRNVTILKGTSVPSNCMVGAAALLCKEYAHPNCVLAGVPAKEVKQDIDWVGERI